MSEPFNTYEVLKVTGGWGVAHAPQGEFVGVYDSLLDATVAKLELEQSLIGPVKYWAIEGLVYEARFGKQLGVLADFSFGESSCLQLKQSQFNELSEIYFDENGHPPQK